MKPGTDKKLYCIHYGNCLISLLCIQYFTDLCWSNKNLKSQFRFAVQIDLLGLPLKIKAVNYSCYICSRRVQLFERHANFEPGPKNLPIIDICQTEMCPIRMPFAHTRIPIHGLIWKEGSQFVNVN